MRRIQSSGTPFGATAPNKIERPSGEMAGESMRTTEGGASIVSRIGFNADSELDFIYSNLFTGPNPAIPGTGQIIHTAGNLGYSPVDLDARNTYYGLYFTDTVRIGFERQQLQLANASGMQGLLVQMLGDKVSQTEAKAAASTLAAFGPPAVAPLVTALADADDVRTPAIEGALRAIGLNDAAAVCGPLLSMLEHQSGRYSWLMQRSAIRVIADVHCPEARTLLQTYRQALTGGTLKAFDPATEEWNTLPAEIVALLKADVDRALLDPR